MKKLIQNYLKNLMFYSKYKGKTYKESYDLLGEGVIIGFNYFNGKILVESLLKEDGKRRWAAEYCIESFEFCSKGFIAIA